MEITEEKTSEVNLSSDEDKWVSSHSVPSDEEEAKLGVKIMNHASTLTKIKEKELELLSPSRKLKSFANRLAAKNKLDKTKYTLNLIYNGEMLDLKKLVSDLSYIKEMDTIEVLITEKAAKNVK